MGKDAPLERPAAAVALFYLLSTALASAWTAPSAAIESTGGWSSNASFVSVSCVGQTQPVGVSSNADTISYSGFMYTFVLHPADDYDSDGITDEVDLDDDNDGLSDEQELSGLCFDPETTTDPFDLDTDDDRVSDADEAAAGTNPRDAASRFELLDITATDAAVHVTWRGRAGKQYHLMGRSDLVGSAPQVLGTTTAVNGSGLWAETETTLTAPAAEEAVRIFHVEISGGEP